MIMFKNSLKAPENLLLRGENCYETVLVIPKDPRKCDP